MTSQIIETESPDEQRYREVSAKLTALNVEIEEAEGLFDSYRFTHPKITFTALGVSSHSDSHREQLENRVLELQRQRQAIFPLYAELKFRLLER